ncbi:putative RNA polymerase [Bacillus sp. TS-2]|nr:putative RNA polymerase [Bacillus sp. TS-2]
MGMMKKNEEGLFKGKTVKVIATAALLATLGTSAAFAADGKNAVPTGQEESTPIVEVENDLTVETREDGKTYYSTDNGKTWSEDVPAGFSSEGEGVLDIPEEFEIGEEGTLLLNVESEATAFAADGKNDAPTGQEESTPVVEVESDLAVEIREDGKTYYSTDSGKTWSLDVPEGFSISHGEGEESLDIPEEFEIGEEGMLLLNVESENTAR